MKFIKLFESWHQDYSYDFLDRGFELEETTSGSNKTLKGSYKGKYVLTELNDEFADMINRLSYNYEILRVKTYFNGTTGNASFELEVSNKFKSDNYIEFIVKGDKMKFYPNSVVYISLSDYTLSFRSSDKRFNPYISISGKLESGATRTLSLFKDTSNNNIIKCSVQGLDSKKPTIDKENIDKLFNMIDEDKIVKDYVDKYEDIKKIITG